MDDSSMSLGDWSRLASHSLSTLNDNRSARKGLGLKGLFDENFTDGF